MSFIAFLAGLVIYTVFKVGIRGFFTVRPSACPASPPPIRN